MHASHERRKRRKEEEKQKKRRRRISPQCIMALLYKLKETLGRHASLPARLHARVEVWLKLIPTCRPRCKTDSEARRHPCMHRTAGTTSARVSPSLELCVTVSVSNYVGSRYGHMHQRPAGAYSACTPANSPFTTVQLVTSDRRSGLIDN